MGMYERAAELGHPAAQKSLGALLWEQNQHEQAREWLAKAAATGNASAYWVPPAPLPKPTAAEAAEVAAARTEALAAAVARAAVSTPAGVKASERAWARDVRTDAVSATGSQTRRPLAWLASLP